MPLIELVNNESFKKYFLEALEPKTIHGSTDYVNLQDDQPAVIISLMIENREDSSPSFYVSLSIYDEILHNYPLDTVASHHPMPKVVMDKLSLEITKPYQLASTQLKKSVFQITEEEGPLIWDMSFDGACCDGAIGIGEVPVSPTQECIDSSFILTFQVTKDTTTCEVDLIIQQVYKTSQ